MKLKHLLLTALCAVMGIGSSWAEWTDITNGNNLSFTTKVGFGDPGAKHEQVYEIWTNNASAAFDLNQTVAELPAGIYELSANAMYRASLTYGTPTNCVIYATIGEKTFSAPIKNFGDGTAKEEPKAIGQAMVNHNAYSTKIPYIIVEASGAATIGMKTTGALTYCTNGYWFIYNKASFTFKNVTATYFTKLQEQATAMVDAAQAGDAKTALNNALTTYNTATVANVKGLRAAIESYLLAAGTDENPIDVTSYIENPSFEGGKDKVWIQDFGYKQPADFYQPSGWDLIYKSAVVNNTAYQSFTTQTTGAKDGNCLYVRHRWSDVLAVEDLRQSVRELPAGKYRLTVAVKGGSSVTDANTLTLKAGNNTSTTTISNYDKTNYKDYSVTVIKTDAESSLDICYGLKQTAYDGEQLFYIDDFRLEYLGDPLKGAYADLIDKYNNTSIPDGKYYAGLKTQLQTAKDEAKSMYDNKTASTVEEIQEKIQAIDDVLSAIETSKTDYAFLNTNITYAEAYMPVKTGTTGYQDAIDAAKEVYSNANVETCAATIKSLTDYKVADYDWAKETYTNEAVLGAWTNTFAEKNVSTEGYAAGTTYYNEWGNNTRSINQTVKLPAGDYILYGAGRGATNVQYAQLYYKIGTNDRVSVNYLMKGNTGLGIDTDGKTNFSAEGTYTRENKGMGWEYRFIAFTLAEETDVEIGTEAQFTNTWVSVYAPKLFAADNAVQALRVIEIATALGENNANVPTGKMNAEVQSTLEAKVLAAENATASNTKEQLNTIYSELVDAISAANTSIANYAAVVPYNTKAEALDAAGQESYAETLAAYNDGSLTKDDEEAQAKAAYIAAVKAQTSENAVFTGLLANPSFEEGTGGWTNDRNTTGTYDYRTDGTTPADGSKTLNVWAQQINYSNVWQKQTLPAGYYTLSAKVRTNLEPLNTDDKNTQVRTYVNNQKTSNSESLTDYRTGNDWNAADAWVTLTTEFMLTQETEVEMGIYSYGENLANNSRGWYQVDDFQLIRVCDVESATMTCAADKYATFCAPFDVTLPENVEAYSAALNDAKNEVTLTSTGATTVSAGTPVIIMATSNINETFYGVKETEGNYVTVGILTGMFTDSENVPMNSYVLQTNGEVQAFYKVNVNDYKFTPNRCYLTIPDGASARLSIVLDDEETGINDLGTENGVIADGKYMQNNKVVIVKNGRKYNVTGQLVK